jgi:hypothetical protein
MSTLQRLPEVSDARAARQLPVVERLSSEKTLSIMPTFRCTAACQDCGTMSNPRQEARLDWDVIFEAIEQAAGAGYRVVVFTGGEPTLAGPRLADAIRSAVSRGLHTRMVTNAHWANSDETASDRVRVYADAGLREINFSTGDEHVRFVPLDYIFRATQAAAQHGLTIAIMIEQKSGRSLTLDSVLNDPRLVRTLREFPSAEIRVIESPWMPLDPDAKHQYPEGMTANRKNISMRTGCPSVLSTTTLQADGRLAACCGLGIRLVPELQLGRFPELPLAEADRIAGNDFLKRWIRTDGPESILAWAAQYDESILWENRYAHQCQACLRLYTDRRVRKVIADHYQEKIVDVLFREWLLYHFQPERGTPGVDNHLADSTPVLDASNQMV